MESTDESLSNTGYEPKDYFLTETYVEFNQESMAEERFPEQRFLEDVDYDDAENKSITPSEKACLLVSRRRPCPIERGNPLWKQVKK